MWRCAACSAIVQHGSGAPAFQDQTTVERDASTACFGGQARRMRLGGHLVFRLARGPPAEGPPQKVPPPESSLGVPPAPRPCQPAKSARPNGATPETATFVTGHAPGGPPGYLPVCRLLRRLGRGMETVGQARTRAPVRVLRRPVSAAGAEQGGDAVAGECGSAVAVPSGHLLVRDQRVGHGLLGGLHYRREERVHLCPGDEPELIVVTPRTGRVVAAESPRVGGG